MTIETLNRFLKGVDTIGFYNTLIKEYHNGKKQVVIYKDNVIHTGDLKSSEKKDKKYKYLIQQLLDDDISIDDYEYKNNRSKIISQRRTLNKVYDISRCNDWEYFVTLTFNPTKVNSFNYDECSSKVSSWIDTIRRYNKDLKYIGVPEKHKSGRYHFHFLFSNCDNLKLVDSGLFTKSGLIIYNIDNYNWGYSTATEVTNTDAVNKYIAKYLTKDLFGSTKGKKRYWSSRNCNIPKEIKQYNSNVSETINKFDNSVNLLHKQVKSHDFLSEETGEIIQRDIIYYEFDKE